MATTATADQSERLIRRNVSLDDDDLPARTPLEEYRTRVAEQNRIRSRFEAVVVMVAAVIAFYVLDLAAVLAEDARIYRPVLYLGLGCFAVFTAIGCYLTVVSPLLFGTGREKEDMPQGVIVVATVFMVGGLILCSAGLWPVWGFFAPLLVLLECCGAMMSVSFMP